MTDGTDRTVWVVSVRKDGSPHPFVEAVYDNAQAANDHLEDVADSLDVVAWDVHKRTVRTETGGVER